MKKTFSIFVILLQIFLLSVTSAEVGILKKIPADKYTKYILRLANGDIVSGYIVESVNDPREGEGIKLRTELGVATIFETQIIEIRGEEDYYRHSHRLFLLPTAEPIGNGHFAGVFEMLFIYAGAGIGDIFSITAGRTFIPGISKRQQAAVCNVKATLLRMPFDTLIQRLSIAIGGNLAFVNDENRLIHGYGTGTVKFERTSITATVFCKAGSEDFYLVHFGGNNIEMKYADGRFGVGFGMDTKFSTKHDLHFIGEIWNSDVTVPTSSGVLLGLRLCNAQFSADFGISFFTQPLVAPFASFVWTPF